MWAASLVGAWWEALLSVVLTNLTGDRAWWRPVGLETILYFAEPYGFGAAVIILVVIPLHRRYRFGPLMTFTVSAVLCVMVELASALVLIALLGTNPFWDFSSYPFDLNGLTSPASLVVFGVFATTFVQFGYPATTSLLRRLTGRQMAWVCGVTLALYLIALAQKLHAMAAGV